jgi:hypothetical protein
MSSLLLLEALEGSVAGGVVGDVALPVAPDDLGPGVGKDAFGVGVTLSIGSEFLVALSGDSETRFRFLVRVWSARMRIGNKRPDTMSSENPMSVGISGDLPRSPRPPDLHSGSRGRRFKSGQPDQENPCGATSCVRVVRASSTNDATAPDPRAVASLRAADGC